MASTWVTVEPIRQFRRLAKMSSMLDYSTDGSALFVSTWSVADGHYSSRLLAIDVQNGSLTPLAEDLGGGLSCCTAPELGLLATKSFVCDYSHNREEPNRYSGDVNLFDLTGGENLRSIPYRGRSFAHVIAPWGHVGVAVEHVIHWWDCDNGIPTEIESCSVFNPEWPDATYCMYSCAFSPNKSLFVTGDSDGDLRFWEPESWRLLSEGQGHSHSVETLTFSPDGQLLASGGGDYGIGLWSTQPPHLGKRFKKLKGHLGDIHGLAFFPEERLLVSASSDRSIGVWDMETWKLKFKIKAHSRDIRALAVAPDGETFATASEDNSVKIWSVRSIADIRA
jgi:WD40 repeat protein